jgi:predicted Zn finger-like uncharacterized protein
MSMATRCPACGTVFRVVQDQLRVSEGWVRCGRCAEVFNAVEHLVDAATAGVTAPTGARTPPQPVPAMMSVRTATAPAAPVPREEAPWEAPSEAPWPEPSEGPAAERPLPAMAPPPPAPRRDDDELVITDADPAPVPPDQVLPPARGDDRPAVMRSRARAADPRDAPDDSGWAAEEAAAPDIVADPTDRLTDPTAPRSTAPAPAQAPRLLADDTPAGVPQPLPSFLRKADTAARWRQPRVRAALALGCVAAAALLGAQALHTWRDQAGARWPGMAPLLQQACAVLGCTVGPPRQIEALAVDSSALVRVSRSQEYRLSVTLRNRAPVGVAAPSLDLTLTDAQGQPLARRVLAAAELGANAPALPAGGEWVLQATLRADGPVVAGYTIELFYP